MKPRRAPAVRLFSERSRRFGMGETIRSFNFASVRWEPAGSGSAGVRALAWEEVAG